MGESDRVLVYSRKLAEIRVLFRDNLTRIKMMKTLLFLLLGALFLANQASASTAGSRQLLSDDLEKVQEEVAGMIEKFWGGICISDDQCLEVVAFCDKTAGKSAQSWETLLLMVNAALSSGSGLLLLLLSSCSWDPVFAASAADFAVVSTRFYAVVAMIRVTLQQILMDKLVLFDMVSDGSCCS